MKNKGLIVTLYFFLVTSLSACSHLAYYSQAIQGHFDLMSRRQEIVDILTDSQRENELLRQLETANEIRDFASRTLGLPDNGSYRSYVDTRRQFVTWAVYAAPELSLNPKRWCFPIAGCVPYRGYFSESQALDMASGLTKQGFDVHVAGVSAYSTLGWFDDPLLNTMLERGEIVMAGLIFHELAHQRIYIENDTEFNEAFATVVQQEGVRLWLTQYRSRDVLEAFEVSLSRQQDFYGLLKALRERLIGIYESDLTPFAKRKEKQQIFLDTEYQYSRLKGKWGGYGGYDAWFAGSLNNAKIASIAVYRDRVPDLMRLLQSSGGDFRLFYTKIEELARLTAKQRRMRLRLVDTK